MRLKYRNVKWFLRNIKCAIDLKKKIEKIIDNGKEINKLYQSQPFLIYLALKSSSLLQKRIFHKILRCQMEKKFVSMIYNETSNQSEYSLDL